MSEIPNAIRAWLHENNATHLATTPSMNGDLHWYSVNGKMLLVHVYQHGDGWEVYIPASNSNRTDKTLQEMNEYVTLT